MNTKSHLQKQIGLLAAAAALSLALLAGGTGISLAAGDDSPAEQVTTPPSTPLPGQIQLPTATPTLVGGPTATPTRTPTLVPVMAETIGDPTNLRSGPGLDFEIVGTVEIGTMLPIVGRSVLLPWVVVEWPDGPDGRAWVFEQLIVVRGDITTVPVVEPPAAPTANPTQLVLEATATILIQTPGAVQTATAQAFAVPTGVFTQTPQPGLAPGGVLPTFTPPEPYAQPSIILPQQEASTPTGGVPPAAVIIVLGAMGFLALVLGLLRRL
ncbi:MAG: hypothetical protein Kow00124_01910 [Anaerolineae bacterium]